MPDSPATPSSFDVRLLGGLHVIRADGSVVPDEAWRTAKTMDLFRILALDAGRRVRADHLITLLWPAVDLTRGRGSLRTAFSRIRQVVGVDCVRRLRDDVILVGASVDVADLRELADAVRRAAAEQRHDQTLKLAESVERLYRADFHAADDRSSWAVMAREDLRRVRLDVLLTAVDAAQATGAMRLALTHALTAVRADPTSEAAQRAVMRAHAELGETAQALRAFEDYRRRLADELGVDPSPETRALHLELLHDRA